MNLIKKISLLVIIIILLSGCNIENKKTENIEIYYTTYPIKYILNKLYGDYSKIQSIYPTGVNINEYELSERKLEEYSKSDLFVFNSLDKDRNYAVKMINMNTNLKVIDGTLGMNVDNDITETWLNPYNYLMIAENIKNGLNEYIKNPYITKKINNNFKEIRYNISKLDSDLTETINNARYKTIVTDNDSLKFLEKYGLKIISLDERNDLSLNTINEVNKLISNEEIKYIYSFESESNKSVKKIIDEKDVELITINSMHSIDGNIENTNDDYISIMINNINLIKKELYK